MFNHEQKNEDYERTLGAKTKTYIYYQIILNQFFVLLKIVLFDSS